MKWVFYFLTTVVAFSLFPALVTAQIYNVMSVQKIRSSADFLSNSNIIGSLPKDSKIKVLEVKVLPSGSQALRVEIVSSIKPPTEASPTEPLWIYRKSNADYVEVTAETAKVKTAKTEGKTEDYCATCQDAAMKKNRNHKDLSTVTQSVEKENSKASISLDSNTSALRELVKKYSESIEVEATIAKAKKLFGRNTHPKLKCYRAVKEALAASPQGTKNSGLIPGRFDDEAALNAKNSLKDYGFVNLLDSDFYKSEIKDPSDAPRGSILVYSSGKRCARSRIKDCGHIEIKTAGPGSPGYISDYYSNQPITKFSNYKLVGVMVKPMDGAK